MGKNSKHQYETKEPRPQQQLSIHTGCGTLPECALRGRWRDDIELIKAEIARSFASSGRIREVDAAPCSAYLRQQSKQWKDAVSVGNGKWMHVVAAVQPIIDRLDRAVSLINKGERQTSVIESAIDGGLA